MDAPTLPFSGSTPLSCHHSASAAMDAAKTRGIETRRYLDLLATAPAVGFSDHEAAKALGLGLSSINSIRNGVALLVWPADRVERNPTRPNIKRTCWRLASPEEQR